MAQVVAEVTAAPKTDPVLRFTPTVAGTYKLHIHDVKYEGLQNYVYRLTITDGQPSNSSEGTMARRGKSRAESHEGTLQRNESEPNNDIQTAPLVELPTLATGTMMRPGDVDVWAFDAKKGKGVTLEVDAAKLGSPLQAVVAVRDAEGKELMRRDSLADSNGGSAD